MDWFRWHHGSVMDPKFQLIARKAGASVAEVVAVWAFLLEAASQSEDRGSLGNIDFESMDCALGMDEGKSSAIHQHMTDRGLIDSGRVTAWDARQPKRERDDSSADRTRAWRAKQSQEKPSDATVTPSDASETPRGEEIRGDVSAKADMAKVSDLCPHSAIVEAYHETLPTARRIRDWTPARQQALRARWREKTERQSLDWWKEFFAYVAKSDFLCGRSPASPGRKPFELSLDWLCKSENFVKVLEGAYES
jgi:hypothetical protein